MVKIETLKISNIGPISDLELKFDPHFNIICGQNGIGKTTILDCLAQSFTISQTTLKIKTNAKQGYWSISVNIDQNLSSKSFFLSGFKPILQTYHDMFNNSSTGFYRHLNDVIVFKTHRDIPYSSLVSISSDPVKDYNSYSSEAIAGALSSDLKSWFVNRHLWSKHEGHLDESQLKNIELAKKCFGFLNPSFAFSRVEPASNDIMLRTPTGEIYLEYLSSGYKSCMAVIIGLIKEIELRYKNPSKYIKDFEGIIFIDEIDLHLHPEWQARIYEVLKEILPNAQIFTSTHSPHLIQVAKPAEIIALTLDDSDNIKVNRIINHEYGCQGWTVEEILSDVMGMSETRTKTYTDAIKRFNYEVDNDNYHEAKKQFEILEAMLHPENSLRKILKIQLTGLTQHD